LGFFSNLFIIYKLSLGEFEDEIKEKNLINISIFSLSTYLFTVIMLNALIALMGDTFDRVQSVQ